MIEFDLPEREIIDDETYTITKIPKVRLTLEHSLISVRKWEAKWKRAFLDKKEKTSEELIDYVRCMTINSGVDPIVYHHIPDEVMLKIIQYIEDPMTATTIRRSKEEGAAPKHEIVTAEIIYYWMFTLGIPLELEKWHFNRLMILIEVFGEFNKPKKKQKKIDQIRDWATLNAKRREALKSNG